MTQIAVFGDIHANLPALEAVLADIDERGITDLYCLGDLVGYATQPDAVIDLLQARNVHTLMGNYDEAIGNDWDDCGCNYTDPVDIAHAEQSMTWTRANTSAESKAYLRSLPGHLRADVGGLRVLMCHGSPRKINEALLDNRPDKTFTRLLHDYAAEVLVCGHTHLPYHRTLPDGRHAVNAGSVGKPEDGDNRACYVVLAGDAGNLHVAFVRVAYDTERAAQPIEASPLPDAFAQTIRLGQHV